MLYPLADYQETKKKPSGEEGYTTKTIIWSKDAALNLPKESLPPLKACTPYKDNRITSTATI